MFRKYSNLGVILAVFILVGLTVPLVMLFAASPAATNSAANAPNANKENPGAGNSKTAKNKHEPDKNLAILFTKLDKNNDKFLDKAEINVAATMAFNSRDANKDGFIERDERKSWLSKKIVDDNGGKEGKLPRKEFMTLVMTRFAAADRQNREKINVEEFGGWRMGKALAKLIQPPAVK